MIPEKGVSMALAVTDLIAFPSRADADSAISGLARSTGNQPTLQTANFLVALAFACDESTIDFAIAASHCANETDLFRDTDWTNDLNCAGIGNTDGSGGIVFPDVRTSARFYCGEMCLKLKISTDWMGAITFARFTPQISAKWMSVKALVSLPSFPVVTQIQHLNDRFGPNNRECVWMCDETGPEAIVTKGRMLFPHLPNQQEEPLPVPTTFTTEIPGLPGGPITTDYVIRVDLLPTSMKLNRPGFKAQSPRHSIQHGNGNPNSSARGERNFLHAGAPNDAGKPQQLSYHATADDKELFVLIPLDEITWQAADGAGPGNHNGYSCEMVEDRDLWLSASRRNRCIHICADFMGRVAARLGVTVPERHWDFNWVECCAAPCDTQCGNRHHCPDKLMSTGLWTTAYVPQWQKARADELVRMKPKLAPRQTIPGDAKDQWAHDRLYLVNATKRRTMATDANQFAYPKEATEAIASKSKLAKGKTVTFDYVVAGEDKDGAPITFFASKAGTHILASAVIKED